MEIDLKPEGILLIDKPTSWTSFDVVAKVRRLIGVKKVGHAGTLDPLATGLLIVLIGKKYTKMQSQFLKQDKSYLAKARLGVTTDTYDSDGQIDHQWKWDEIKNISQEQLEECLANFRGEIEQTVPAFSAIKVKGKKLYDLARQDKIYLSELPTRKVNISKLELVSFVKDEEKKVIEFELKVDCSSGTYIRSLVHDIGQCLSLGAMVTGLRRTKIGAFSIDQAQTMDQLIIQFEKDKFTKDLFL